MLLMHSCLAKSWFVPLSNHSGFGGPYSKALSISPSKEQLFSISSVGRCFQRCCITAEWLPGSKTRAGSTESLNPWGTVQLGSSSGLEVEAMLGPISLRSLCSRLSRDVAYCCPVRPNPSWDREYAMDGNPGASSLLRGKECHAESSTGLKARRRPATGGTCDSE